MGKWEQGYRHGPNVDLPLGCSQIRQVERLVHQNGHVSSSNNLLPCLHRPGSQKAPLLENSVTALTPNLQGKHRSRVALS